MKELGEYIVAIPFWEQKKQTQSKTNKQKPLSYLNKSSQLRNKEKKLW